MKKGNQTVIRVLVVDDHDLVRSGIIRLLSDVETISIVGEAATGEEAISLCRGDTVDVVLMDLRMPGIGGLEATRKIVRQNPLVKVIAVTVCDEDPIPSRLFQAGVSAFLTKGASLDEMLQAIRTAHLGQRYISPQIAQKMALKPFSASGNTNPFIDLSERELQICIMVVNCEKVQDISEQLHLSPKTVNSYRYRIFDKLQISSDVELTRLAIRHGMIDIGAI